jgi:hypothetical protein
VTVDAATQTLAQKQAAALRLFATLIEENPHLAENFSHTLSYSGLHAHSRSEDIPAEMAEFGRVMRRYGAKTDKSITDSMYNLVADFGALSLNFLAYRKDVCELVVTGTRVVTEEVPDPEALAAVPTTKVIRTEDVTEWVCKPLLATDGA